VTAKFLQDVPVTANERLNESHFRLSFRFPELAQTARPGQFITLTRRLDDFRRLRRPFSLHRVTDDGIVQILVKIVGESTAALGNIKAGDTVNVLGPLGDGAFVVDPTRPRVLIVGGGIGIAPFLFLLDEITPRKDFAPEAFFGGRTATDLPALADFEAGDVPLLTATEDGSLGHRGLVTEVFSPRLTSLPAAECQVLACGPPAMLKAVAEQAAAAGVPCQVSLENMMACGVGSCRGCVVQVVENAADEGIPYLRVCHEGPVFEASQLVWSDLA